MALVDETIHPARRPILQASSPLVSAIVLAAVIIHSGIAPLWNDVPVIGIVGSIAAGLVGFGLLVKTIRTGGLFAVMDAPALRNARQMPCVVRLCGRD